MPLLLNPLGRFSHLTASGKVGSCGGLLETGIILGPAVVVVADEPVQPIIDSDQGIRSTIKIYIKNLLIDFVCKNIVLQVKKIQKEID
jgi:hypothetical protein